MKMTFPKSLMARYGKKALYVYLAWCLVKGIAFLFLGMKLFS
jgi:hypothetical protein